MCGRPHGRNWTSDEHRDTSNTPYEGETVRLDTSQAVSVRSAPCLHHCGGFPWWTLWLIWPLFGVIKAIAATLGATALTIYDAFPEIGLHLSTFWPLALVVIGLLLLHYRRGFRRTTPQTTPPSGE